MARKRYGKTWWGQAWIKAMERIDYDTNRLPRGRTYANTGKVLQIQVEGREVQAYVKGRRAKPYSVDFHLKPFLLKERERVLACIKDDPSLKAQLALGRLPEVILEELAAQSIDLLPTSWKDINAHCSCPDWANPCKHLAAVYYLVANEIDQDPFLLFHLRGLDKEEMVEEELLDVAKEEDDFLDYQDIEISVSKQGELPSLSFSSNRGEAIFSLLPKESTFYQGNLKEDLLKNYRRAAKELERFELLEEDETSPLKGEEVTLLYKDLSPSRLPSIEIFLYPKKRISLPSRGIGAENLLIQDKERYKVEEREGLLLEVSSFILQLLKTPLSQAKEYNSTLRFLVEASAVAQSMVQSFLLLPKLKRDREGNFSILYQPHLYTEETQEAFQHMVETYPQNLIIDEQGRALSKEKGAEKILSILLTEILHLFSKDEDSETLYTVFFKGEEYRVEGFAGSQTAKAVSDWLLLLHLPEHDLSPLLRVEPKEDDHFFLHVLVEKRGDPFALPLALKEVFAAREEVFSLTPKEAQGQVSRQLTLASDSYPPLREVLSSKGEKILTLDGLEMLHFIEHLQGVFHVLGMKVLLPKELRKIYQPRISLQGEVGSEGGASYFNMEEALQFSWQVALGDAIISKEEFESLTATAKGIVRFQDGYVLLDPEEVKKVFLRLQSPLPSLERAEILKGALGGEIDGVPFFKGEGLQRLIEDLKEAPPIEEPEGLVGELRTYQLRGYQWLYANVSRGFGICLADDMGLGKTIQALALILKLKEEGRLETPVLIICPTTLVGNWSKEAERFAPSLRSYIYHGQERRLQRKGFDLIITTYGLIRREKSRFKTTDWSLILMDEAQNIKNPSSQQAKATKSLKAKGYLAMTGTPVENRLSELWSIFDFLNRGYLGSHKDFISTFALPIERYRDEKKIEILKKITAPFIMRRLKSDTSIIQDLPPKIVENEYCPLTPKQAALYQEVVKNGLEEMESSEGIKRQGYIFKLMTSLKQICNHPAQFSKKGSPKKEQSGKVLRALSLLEEIIGNREKVLIFTQYKEMGHLLQAIIEEELRVAPLFFHGSLSRGKREDLITSFQEGPSPIFIISLKAGGTGLNLTAASHVIHYDLWWNPAVEDQATDRTYRIGQTQRVIVKRLITLGTFEEKIDAMIQKKKELAHLTLSTGEKWLFDLSNQEIKELMELQAP